MSDRLADILKWTQSDAAKLIISEKDKERKDKTNAYVKERLRTNVQFRLRMSLHSRLLSALKVQNVKKIRGETQKLLGCTIEDLKLHLESLWKPGMSWETHAIDGWHIDHIKPCAKFDLRKIRERRRCFNWTNLQPLWWWENLSKGDRWAPPAPITTENAEFYPKICEPLIVTP